MGVDRSSGVAALGCGTKSTLGGGTLLWRRRSLMSDEKLNFYGAVLSAGAGR